MEIFEIGLDTILRTATDREGLYEDFTYKKMRFLSMSIHGKVGNQRGTITGSRSERKRNIHMLV